MSLDQLLATPLSRRTREAVSRYGRGTCAKAFAMHYLDGEGAFTVGFYLGLTTRQADAAIAAGEELVKLEWHIELDCLTCSCSFKAYAKATRGLIG